MNNRQRAEFWNVGYVVGESNLSMGVFAAAVEEVEGLTFDSIFADVYGKADDPYRMQASVKELGPELRKINEEVGCIVATTEENWKLKASSWHALKSLPGGGRQAPHKDFPTFETAKAILRKDCVQASVIVALQPNTQFIVCPGCIGTAVDVDDAQEIKMDRGHYLFFRGDLVHSGAAYDQENVRLHCFILVKGIKQKDNATEAAIFNSYLCKYCLKPWESKRGLANHIRYCPEKDSDEKGDSGKRPAGKRDEAIQCDQCGKMFGKRNSYNQHKRRKHAKQSTEDSGDDEDSESSGNE